MKSILNFYLEYNLANRIVKLEGCQSIYVVYSVLSIIVAWRSQVKF
jgi:hypothetical protein